MNSQLALGFFALYVVGISLWRLMSGRGLPLAESSRIWERRRQLLPHFLVNVAAPLVVGVIFISRGIVGLGGEPARPYDAIPQRHVYQQVAAVMELNCQARIAAADLWAAAERMETGSLVWSNLNLKP